MECVGGIFNAGAAAYTRANKSTELQGGGLFTELNQAEQWVSRETRHSQDSGRATSRVR